MSERDPDDIVITGIGCITPVGLDVTSSMDAIFAGQHGFTTMPADIGRRFPRLKDYPVAPVPDFDMTDNPVLSPRGMNQMHRSAQFAVWATAEALAQANMIGDTKPPKDVSLLEHHRLISKVDPQDVGMRMGTGMGGGDEVCAAWDEMNELNENGETFKGLPPSTVLKVLIERVASVPAMSFGIEGPTAGVVAACATGAANIAAAADLLRLDRAKVVVAGGTEAQVTAIGAGLFDGLPGALDSTKDPELASRPLDQDRAGFVIGEGAGAVVMETREHALGRGATILATLVGYAETTDAGRSPTSPTGKGLARAMDIAMRDVTGAKSIYVHAHATGTKVGDVVEGEAIIDTLEQDQVAGISSTKASTGHTLGAAGVIGAIVAITALHLNQVPGTRGLTNPIDSKGWPLPADTMEPEIPIDTAMANAAGFGGLNTSLVFQR